MKVIKAFGPRDLRVVDVPIPEPAPGYVRIKVCASGICGSDKWIWYANEKTDEIAGHEAAGVIDKLGEGVTTLALGDRVMINNVVGCGKCSYCHAGAFVLCPFWDGSRDVNNGFGEYVVAPARNCVHILPGLDFIDGAGSGKRAWQHCDDERADAWPFGRPGWRGGDAIRAHR